MGKIGATEIIIILAIPFIVGFFIGKGVGFKQGVKFISRKEE